MNCPNGGCFQTQQVQIPVLNPVPHHQVAGPQISLRQVAGHQVVGPQVAAHQVATHPVVGPQVAAQQVQTTQFVDPYAAGSLPVLNPRSPRYYLDW